jgi:adenylate cyclase
MPFGGFFIRGGDPMATGDVKRKLTAIFSADVKGYSRLMGEDELGTIETLTSHKEIMGKLIRQYRGRLVDSTGDNLLAEFGSVVDAVQCAVEVQQVLSAKNETLPENRRMYFRIGINLGDVVEEGERIYGDGVNVAARVESLAEGGGISISGTAYDQLGKKLPLGYEYLGEQSVKNIEKPVRVYRVLPEAEAAGKVIGEKRLVSRHWRWAAVALVVVAGALAVWNFYFRPPFEPASVERMAYPLPDKPSIAVLPFDNMSGDPEQDYLADGISENIISALSKISRLLVIARNSTFTYKGKPVKVQKVAEDLGVRYVLEGSIQRSDNTLRITAQLIDAIKGHHLWSQRFDRELKNIFTLQDEIAMKIVTALQVKLTEGERARLSAKGTDNLEAYLKLLQARELFLTVTKEGNALARRLLEEVIVLDSQFPAAYVLLGGTHFMDVPLGLSKSRKESFKQAFQLTKRAIDLDESYAIAYPLLGWLYVIMGRQYERGIAECEKAISLAPNLDVGYIWKGFILTYAGRHEEGVQFCEQALRLNPIPPAWYFRALGIACSGAKRYDEAIAAFKKSLQGAPKDIITHEALAVAYSWAGRLEEAHAQSAEILRINPKYSIEQRAMRGIYRSQADRERYVDGLRKAGLPEIPPLPLPDKPSIAVLPFVNMSGDPEQEYFSDGITEEIITALSKVPDLFVIARNSSFTYKGKSVRIPTVGRELGVRYVLEGSVRKAGEKVRVTAQLVDAKTGNHLWAERYDRDLKDIFALQDEITMKIITAMRVKLTEGEQARLAAKGTDNLEAYLKHMQAREYVAQLNKEDNALARKLAEEAISLDPEYAAAYVALGSTHWMDIVLGSSKSPKESLRRAFELTTKAIALDDSNAGAHVSLSFIYMMKRQHDKAIAEAERAVELAPSLADAYFSVSRVLRYAGRAEEAITWNKKAIRLDPMPFGPYLMGLAHAYWMAGRYEEAIPACKKALLSSPKNTFSHMVMVATYISLGREEEARAEAQEVLRIDPKFSLANWAKRLPFKNQTDREHFFAALGKAGLK